MKNKSAIFFLAFLLVVGLFVIYQEALADIVVACFTCQYCCDWYGGTFAYQDCWWWQGVQYCNFSCTNFQRLEHNMLCYWFDPTYGMCQEPH